MSIYRNYTVILFPFLCIEFQPKFIIAYAEIHLKSNKKAGKCEIFSGRDLQIEVLKIFLIQRMNKGMNFNAIKPNKRHFITLLSCLLCLIGQSLFAQQHTVTGRVTADGESVAGASVMVKGTGIVAIATADGSYSISVPGAGSVLRFSFLGYSTHEETVGSRSVINVNLQPDAQQIDNVVVTALGISREEKSLGYSVGNVSGDELVTVPQNNVLNSLSGRVSGVTINQTGSTGSSVSMVIRGQTSLAGDNQPLFVVDGVPVANTLNNIGEFGSGNAVDYGNAISDLNPEDIESINILKGPSAAALYGSRAGNGVVVVTTKSGNSSRGLQVNVSSNTVFDMPYKYYRKQDKFASGYRPVTPDDMPEGEFYNISTKELVGMGMPLNKGYKAIQWSSPIDPATGKQIPTEVVGYDNLKNFVQTGITTTNSVSLSDGNERMNFRMGVTNMLNKGIIPGTDLNRNNYSAAGELRSNKFTFSTNINYTQSWADNRPAGNRGVNPLEYALWFPNNLDLTQFEDYWVEGSEGEKVYTLTEESNNPYFLAHEVKNSFRRDRIFGNVMAEYQILPQLSAMVRMTMDSFSERRETKIPVGYSQEASNGAYGLADITSYERNADFLIRWNDNVGKFDYTLSAGGNEMYTKSTNTSNSSMNGRGLISPNVFSITNIAPENLNYSSTWSQKAIKSLYAFANLSWDGMVYLDLTARNDWSSTLPKANRSYFYPSASLSLLVNEMFDLGSKVDLLKLRGGWAQVGNDTSPYQLLATYERLTPWGNAVRYGKSGNMLAPNLKPERATSIEFGSDMSFFQNRLRFEGTWFQVNNENQIVQNVGIPVSSGYSNTNLNMGMVQSRGWEFSIGGTPVKTADWQWDIDFNLTRSRSILKELAPGISRLTFWAEASAAPAAWTNVGEEIGNIYAQKEIRVEDPSSPYYKYPILDDTGAWTNVSRELANNKMGNWNPDAILGGSSVLRYKNLSLSFTFDWRIGGEFFSQTERRTRNNGMSPRSYEIETIDAGGRTGRELRDWLVENDYLFTDDSNLRYVGGPGKDMGGYELNYGGQTAWDGSFRPGVIEQRDENGNVTGYIEHLGEGSETKWSLFILMDSSWHYGQAVILPADFIKLRDISFTYDFPARMLRALKIKDLSVSLFSRNIMVWTKAKMNIDPERAFTQSASTEGRRGTQMRQGMEEFNIEPWVMPIGVKLNLTF